MENLIAAAKDLNKVVGCFPALPIDEETFLARKKEEEQEDMSDKDFLLKEMKDASELIELPKDRKLSKATEKTLRKLKYWPEEVVEEPKVEKIEEKVEEPKVEEVVEEITIEDLIEDIRATTRLPLEKGINMLKDIINDFDDFESMRKTIAGAFNATDIRNEMLTILGVPKEELIADIKVTPVVEKSKKKAATKKKETKPVVNKEGGTVKPLPKHEGSMAQFADGILQEGGTWKAMFEVVFAENESRESKAFKTLGSLKGHTRYRLSKNPEFLGTKKMTDNEIK